MHDVADFTRWVVALEAAGGSLEIAFIRGDDTGSGNALTWRVDAGQLTREIVEAAKMAGDGVETLKAPVDLLARISIAMNGAMRSLKHRH